MSSSLLTLVDHVPAALLVIFRLGGLMIYGPIFGAPVIPARVKIFLAVIIGLAVYPVVSTLPGRPTDLSLDLGILGPLIATEILLGLAIGFIASLPMVAVQIGGLVMGQQMGLGFARFYNPAMDDDADVVGQLFFFMALAGFLLIGGHEAMLLAVLHSFEHVPLAASVADTNLIALLTGLLVAAYELALRVAAPLLVLIFLQTVAMGFLARTVPQLNILSLGFPLRILAGLSVILVAVSVMNDVLMDTMGDAIDITLDWIDQWSPATE